MRKLLMMGGWISGALLVLFGLAVLWMSFDALSTVRASLERENISFGSVEDPAVAEHAPQWAGQPVATGAQARAFADIIRSHTQGRTGGLSYSEMGRFVSAADPEDLAGTSDTALALKDEVGNPVPNRARDTWVTATALTTALNMAYLSEQLALFGLVVGLSLLIVGIGLLVLNGYNALPTVNGR